MKEKTTKKSTATKVATKKSTKAVAKPATKKATTKQAKVDTTPAVEEITVKTVVDGNETEKVIRKTYRTEEEKKVLRSRLNRIGGQIKAITNMIEDNRFCEDVLIQLASAYKSIKVISNMILEDHLVKCVKEGVQKDDYSMVDEAMEIFRRYQ